jgi:hypothetical protein
MALGAGYYTRAILVPVPPIFSGLDRRVERIAQRPRNREAVQRGRGASLLLWPEAYGDTVNAYASVLERAENVHRFSARRI